MPKPCSLDLRERVLDAVETGASRREAAERFEVSASSAVKWMQRWHETGSVAAKPTGGSISPPARGLWPRRRPSSRSPL
jgi:transposase